MTLRTPSQTGSTQSSHRWTRTRGLFAATGRLALALTLLAGMVGGVGLISVLGRPSAAPVAGPAPQPAIEPAAVAPGSATPDAQHPVPTAKRKSTTGLTSIRAWANQLAAVINVPARALVSYARADLAMSQRQPGCNISWATLAGIGRIESNHGRYGGRELLESGLPSRPIIGIRLDGGPNIQAIHDTDNGRLDGDRVYDRAVGPMQFIPSTWQKWSTDGNGDGVGNPQNLDDAAMAAARYLCAGDRDMSTGNGWWSAVMSYNHSVEYAQKVFAVAERYAQASNRRT